MKNYFVNEYYFYYNFFNDNGMIQMNVKDGSHDIVCRWKTKTNKKDEEKKREEQRKKDEVKKKSDDETLMLAISCVSIAACL